MPLARILIYHHCDMQAAPYVWTVEPSTRPAVDRSRLPLPGDGGSAAAPTIDLSAIDIEL